MKKVKITLRKEWHQAEWAEFDLDVPDDADKTLISRLALEHEKTAALEWDDGGDGIIDCLGVYVQDVD